MKMNLDLTKIKLIYYGLTENLHGTINLQFSIVAMRSLLKLLKEMR